jgi:acylphosphatase
MKIERVRVTVRGHVQGVGFRASAAHEARRLGVEGWVRNLADGGVELRADGDPEAVDALLEWLGHGPPGAEVTDVEVVDVTKDAAAASEALQGFRVRP